MRVGTSRTARRDAPARQRLEGLRDQIGEVDDDEAGCDLDGAPRSLLADVAGLLGPLSAGFRRTAASPDLVKAERVLEAAGASA